MSEDDLAIGPALGDYLTVVTRRFWTIIVPFLLVALGATATAFLLPAEFDAVTRVRVDDPEVVGSFYAQVGLPVPHKQILQTMPQDIGSPDFFMPIAEKCDVTEGFNAHDPRERARLMKRVQDRLSVKIAVQKAGPDVFEISYTGRDAAKVANFVNAVRNAYLDEFMFRYQDLVKNAHLHVKRLFDSAKGAYDGAAKGLQDFQNENGPLFVGNVSDVGEGLRTNLTKAEESLAAAEALFAGETKKLGELRAKIALESPTVEAATEKVRNPQWETQNALVGQLETRLQKLAERQTDQHPEYKAAKDELESARAKLAQTQEWIPMKRTVDGNPVYVDLTAQARDAEAKLDALTGQITKTKSGIEALKASLKVLPEKTRQLNELRERYAQTTVSWERASRAWAQAEATYKRVVQNETTFYSVLVAPDADTAKHSDPVSPNIPLFAGIGAFVGIMLGAGLAFLKEFTSQSFTTVNQVRHQLSVPLLGELPPILTAAEQRSRTRRRVLTAVAVLTFVVVVGGAHIAYFNEWAMPRQIFDLMRRIYGGR